MLQEHCENLERWVLELESKRADDLRIHTSLVADLTHSRALLQETLDRQAQVDQEMDRLKNHLAVRPSGVFTLLQRGIMPFPCFLRERPS